jgi:hypothetical protein
MFAQALLYLCHPSAQRQGTLKRINQRFPNGESEFDSGRPPRPITLSCGIAAYASQTYKRGLRGMCRPELVRQDIFDYDGL